MAETGDGSLWITRMTTDDNDEELCDVGYRDGGARRVFEHAHRVIRPTPSSDLSRGDLIVTLRDSNGDLADDDPLRVPATRADWFLDEWLQVPKSWRTDTGGNGG